MRKWLLLLLAGYIWKRHSSRTAALRSTAPVEPSLEPDG